MDFTSLKNFMDDLIGLRIPGNTISVYYNSKEVFKYSSGYNDVESRTPMQGDEFFNLYSCSKIATAVAAMQLYEKGKFLLNDPLYEYIPEYKYMNCKDENGNIQRAKNPITIQNLFTMTAGLNYDLESPPIQKACEITNGKMNTVTVAKCLSEQVLDFEPGAAWQYSLCHDVLAALVEIISGMKFSEYMLKNVFEPVGIEKIYYHRFPDLKDKMASQYMYLAENEVDGLTKTLIKSADGKGYLKNVGKNVMYYVLGSEYDCGGAGITTTVADYVKFANALANNGLAATGERILSGKTIRLMKTNQLNDPQLRKIDWSQLAGYGYGLGVRTMIDPVTGGSNGNLGEYGWDGAAGAYMLVDTECNLALFYAQHMLNSFSDYIEPRLRNIVYSCLD